MAACLVALGSNVGDRLAQLERAIQRLGEHPSIDVMGRSNWFHTKPIGGPPEQGEFVNAAIRVQTCLSPQELFQVLRRVETDLGRQRRERWAARSMDLDLLLYGDLILKTPQLEIPHPRLAFRRFVLEPAAEVAQDMLHPVVGWTIGQLLEHLNRAPNYVALTGLPGVGKTKLAHEAAKRVSGRFIEDLAEDLFANGCQEDATPNAIVSELDLLESRARQLLAEDWSQDSCTAISDFWIGQYLAYSRIGSSRDEYGEIESAWCTHTDQIPSPKLLVLVDAPVQWLTERAVARTPSSGRHSPDQIEDLCTQLTDVAFHARRGPVLELDATQPVRSLAELTAAIDAMK